MRVEYAEIEEIKAWMTLIEKVKCSFPGLETKEAFIEYQQTVITFMKRQEALCVKKEGHIIGALLFSRTEGELCFLAVDPKQRRKGVGEALVYAMIRCMGEEQSISVSTYRQDDPQGISARAFYKRLGFEEGELKEEYGSPIQRFVLPSRKQSSAI